MVSGVQNTASRVKKGSWTAHFCCRAALQLCFRSEVSKGLEHVRVCASRPMRDCSFYVFLSVFRCVECASKRISFFLAPDGGVGVLVQVHGGLVPQLSILLFMTNKPG